MSHTFKVQKPTYYIINVVNMMKLKYKQEKNSKTSHFRWKKDNGTPLKVRKSYFDILREQLSDITQES